MSKVLISTIPTYEDMADTISKFTVGTIIDHEVLAGILDTDYKKDRDCYYYKVHRVERVLQEKYNLFLENYYTRGYKLTNGVNKVQNTYLSGLRRFDKAGTLSNHVNLKKLTADELSKIIQVKRNLNTLQYLESLGGSRLLKEA